MTTAQNSIKLYLPSDMADRFRQIAYDEGRTVTGQLRMLVSDFLNQHDREALSWKEK